MVELREKVAREVREARHRDEAYTDEEAADAILALPEIREALELQAGLRVVDRSHRA